MGEEDVVMRFRMGRLRGRPDSVYLTLPPAWVRDLGLGPVGLCYVGLHMDSQKRLVITPTTMRDDAIPTKRVLSESPTDVKPSDNMPTENPTNPGQ